MGKRSRSSTIPATGTTAPSPSWICDGKKTDLAAGWSTVQGLAWGPKGREVWFTAAREGIEREIWGVTTSGKLRLVRTMQGTPALLDLRPDGSALLTEDDYRSSVMAFLPGQAERKGSFLVRLVERSRALLRREPPPLRRVGRGRRSGRRGLPPSDRRLLRRAPVRRPRRGAFAGFRVGPDPNPGGPVPLRARSGSRGPAPGFPAGRAGSAVVRQFLSGRLEVRFRSERAGPRDPSLPAGALGRGSPRDQRGRAQRLAPLRVAGRDGGSRPSGPILEFTSIPPGEVRPASSPHRSRTTTRRGGRRTARPSTSRAAESLARSTGSTWKRASEPRCASSPVATPRGSLRSGLPA